MYHIALMMLAFFAGVPHADVRNDTPAWLRVTSPGENIVVCIAPKSRVDFSGGTMKSLFFEFMAEADCKGTRIQYATLIGPGGGATGAYTAWGTAPHYHVDLPHSSGAVM